MGKYVLPDKHFEAVLLGVRYGSVSHKVFLRCLAAEEPKYVRLRLSGKSRERRTPECGWTESHVRYDKDN
jgi:hypothetical protein